MTKIAIPGSTAAVLDVLANSLTPTTLAAVLNDLAENDQLTTVANETARRVSALLRRQLECMVGEDEAEQLVNPEVACDGCGVGSAKIGAKCGHCGELIECDPRG